MVSPAALLYFYRRRLRVHRRQEFLAAVGIAAGVALVFSVNIANSSITGSAHQILRAITGNATLQLATRDAQGFDQQTLARVRRVAGVEHASAVLEQRATIAVGSRQVPIDLVGVDPSLPSLGGFAARHFQVGGLVLQRGVVLPVAVGQALGLSETEGRSTATLIVRGRAQRIAVPGVLGSGEVGPLAGALVGVASLSYAQELTGLTGRVSRVLVVPRPGQEDAVRAALRRLAGDGLTVAPVQQEARLLEQATGPIDQATGLFAAISAFVGLLLTFTAMLLTVPERRRFIADLRVMGYRRARVVQILGFQALVLGAVASAAGLGVGYLLSLTATQDPPGYLAFAFPLGIQRIVSWQTAALPFLGGMLATCLAAVHPLLDLLPGRAINAVFAERGEPGQAVSRQAAYRLACVSAGLLATITIAVALVPSLTVVGVAGIAVAAVLAIPAAFRAILSVAGFAAERRNWKALTLAVAALRGTTIRSIALAATGAVAVFGSVAIEGAHTNLEHGLYRDYSQYAGTADIWITQPDDDLALQPFDADGLTARLRRVRGVRAVRPYDGGLLDLGNRRVWVIARPAADGTMIPPSQIVAGNLATATARLRSGGWMTVSRQIAAEHGVRPGRTLTLPTPTGPMTYRIAATTTNLGWGPGAIILNSADYRRAWATASPSALEVNVSRGADPLAVKAAIRRVLGPGSGLQVQTTGERSHHADGIARQGLTRLTEISLMLLVAAGLAMAAAMGAGLWQRRSVVAQLRIMGWRPPRLWRALLAETVLVLGTACATGALAGMYGHYLGDRWLALSTGYPAPFTFTAWHALTVCLIVAGVALSITAVPGLLVSRTPPRLGLKTSP
jgi:putative ABC transport system permease protein